MLEDSAESQAAAAREFVQFCILPRGLNSPADALYCARFLRKSHALGPPGFRLLTVMDRVGWLGVQYSCGEAALYFLSLNSSLTFHF